MTERYHLDDCQFYVTDRCDMSCDHCITMNNWAWGAPILVEDHLEDLTAWSQTLSIGTVTVLGGEPLTHPELDLWLRTLQRLWPQSRRIIATNGRTLDRINPEWLRWGWIIEISAHRAEDLETARIWADRQWPQSTRVFCEDSGPRSEHIMEIRDAQGQLQAIIRSAQQFNQWPWRIESGKITWDQLNHGLDQHSACEVSDCRYMVGSRLYRCPQQAIFPRVAAAVDQRYQAIAAEDLGCGPYDDLAQWFSTIDLPQSQCSLCAWQEQRIAPVTFTKKIPLIIDSERS